MGGVVQSIFGGSSGSNQQQSSSSSGFSQLPPQVQQAITQYAQQYTTGTGNTAANTAAFTPPALNTGATSALSALSNSAYAPTAANINSSVAEQMDPYNQDVTNLIQQQAFGQNSVLNQDLNTAGQFGSNRSALGANNIAEQQANTMGSILQPEFNTAMSNAITALPTALNTAAAGAVGAGQTQQQQTLAQQQAPYSALSAIASLLGVLPQNGGSTSQSTGSGQSSSSGGILNSLF